MNEPKDIGQLIEWVQAELNRAGLELMAAERKKDDVCWAVAWRKAECLREIEAILSRVKAEAEHG